MPSKYVNRQFQNGGIYHVYNRGVEKRAIFIDDYDRNIFLYYLFIYLAPLEQILFKYPELNLRIASKNLNKELSLISYCLMPNHFHLLLKSNTATAIPKLLKQLTNAYVQYFNQKYHRVGGLMQGCYKAVQIENDEQLIHIVRYIHLNPVVAELDTIEHYPWSSHKVFIDPARTTYLAKDIALNYFKSVNKYQEFVSDQINYAQELHRLQQISID